MTTIDISQAAGAARALVAAARCADADKNGLTVAEIHRASAAGVITERQAKALLREHQNHRIAVYNDHESSSGEKVAGARSMDTDGLKFTVSTAIAQLRQIDEYQGTQKPWRPPNQKDGSVTDAEVKNYRPSCGRLPKEAARLTAFMRGDSGN